MNFVETSIPGCFRILPEIQKDERGIFVKTLHAESYTQNKSVYHFEEEYYSTSQRRVLRGMHFQRPPAEHTKLVYCICGEAIDVVVDLRAGSPTYGKFEMFCIDARTPNIIFIPPGLAHGFYAKSDNVIMLYKVTSIYSRVYDAGIHWNSIGIPWPDENPIVSKRDSELPLLKDFESPFVFCREVTAR